jgi:cysteine synthase B
MSMLKRAEERGDIKPGDTLIEATSGNTGIALAMAAALRGYKMLLLMPENLSVERRQSMAAYGAQIMLTPKRAAWNMRVTWPSSCRRMARASSWTSSPTATMRAHYEGTAGNLARHGGRSPTSSAPWAPRAPSWACRAT